MGRDHYGLYDYEEWKGAREDLARMRDSAKSRKWIPVRCPRCGSSLYEDVSVVLTTVPPRHLVFCGDCDFWDSVPT